MIFLSGVIGLCFGILIGVLLSIFNDTPRAKKIRRQAKHRVIKATNEKAEFFGTTGPEADAMAEIIEGNEEKGRDTPLSEIDG